MERTFGFGPKDGGSNPPEPTAKNSGFHFALLSSGSELKEKIQRWKKQQQQQGIMSRFT